MRTHYEAPATRKCYEAPEAVASERYIADETNALCGHRREALGMLPEISADDCRIINRPLTDAEEKLASEIVSERAKALRQTAVALAGVRTEDNDL